MRPDEHKRKKNAAYKKKHNIQPDKKSCSSREKKDVNHAGHAPYTSQQTSVHQKEDPLPQKVYGRRKIESNWEKYEEAGCTENEAEDTRAHAADYGQLLKETCNVKAQYQFASFEQSTHTYSASEQTVELLSVDVQCLAASVLCVPLHQRLNLDEALFDKSEIDAFNAAAVDKLRQREQIQVNVTSAHCDHEPNSATLESRQCVNDLSLMSSTATRADCDKHLARSSSSSAAVEAEAVISSDTVVSVDCFTSDTARSLSQLENELDTLLSI